MYLSFMVDASIVCSECGCHEWLKGVRMYIVYAFIGRNCLMQDPKFLALPVFVSDFAPKTGLQKAAPQMYPH